MYRYQFAQTEVLYLRLRCWALVLNKCMAIIGPFVQANQL